MANEITELGQIVTYGGAEITLTGSTLSTKLLSILALEGSGTSRGWKQFDPSKSDFLNSKKLLRPGDIVLVNAKTLPMDFPVKTSGSGTTLEPIDLQLQGLTGQTVTKSAGSSFYGSKFTIAPSSVIFTEGAGTVSFSLDNGLTYFNINDFNIAMANTPSVIYFKVKVDHTAPFTLKFTLTFS